MEKQKHFVLTLWLLTCLPLYGCSHLSNRQTNRTEAPKEFAELLARKDELAALPTSEKLSRTPEIKGKIVIVKNHNGKISLDRFDDDGSTFFTQPPV